MSKFASQDRAVGVYELTVGVAVLLWWAFALATGSVPEIDDGDAAIWFHLTAEGLMALALLTAGLLLLRRHYLGRSLSGFALGALLYSTVNSAGYFAESGEGPLVGMFFVLFVGAVIAAWRLLTAREGLSPAPALEPQMR